MDFFIWPMQKSIFLLCSLHFLQIKAHNNKAPIEGRLPLKVAFNRKTSSMEGRLSWKIVIVTLSDSTISMLVDKFEKQSLRQLINFKRYSKISWHAKWFCSFPSNFDSDGRQLKLLTKIEKYKVTKRDLVLEKILLPKNLYF